ncbi:hypothetical protein P5V15_014475 [Pogonomyrmex californicus]
MLALNPSSQHHRSRPAVTNRGVRSNRSRNATKRGGGRGERGGEKGRGERGEGRQDKDKRPDIFPVGLPMHCRHDRSSWSVIVVVGRTTLWSRSSLFHAGEQLLSSTWQPPCLYPTGQQDAAFPAKPRDGVRDRGGSAFISFRSRFASPERLDKRPRGARLLSATGPRNSDLISLNV